MLYMAGMVPLRNETPDAPVPASSPKGEPLEAMRCLCRRLSDAICWQVANDAPAQPPHPGGAPEVSTWSGPSDKRH